MEMLSTDVVAVAINVLVDVATHEGVGIGILMLDALARAVYKVADATVDGNAVGENDERCC